MFPEVTQGTVRIFFLEFALRGANVGALDLIPDRANQISIELFCELHVPFISELPNDGSRTTFSRSRPPVIDRS